MHVFVEFWRQQKLCRRGQEGPYTQAETNPQTALSKDKGNHACSNANVLFLSESMNIFCLPGSVQQAQQSSHLAEGLNPLLS